MNSSIIDMENMHSDEDSDYTGDFSKFPTNDNQEIHNTEDNNDDISKGVANLIWQESNQRARKAFNAYTNIDILRPYFDVEPNIVKQRLISSLVPEQLYKMDGTKIPCELYGPNMIVLSLVAMLLMQMKTANVALKEGTLMGSALGICFGYWLLSSIVLFFFCYLFNIRLAFLQALHLMGYGLFGTCIVVFVTTVIHPNSTHSFFYVITLIFVSLSVLKVISVLKQRNPDQKSLLILLVIIFGFQFLFLFYIHFTYHHDMEELTIINQPDIFQTGNNHLLINSLSNEKTLLTQVQMEENELLITPQHKLKKRIKFLATSMASF